MRARHVAVFVALLMMLSSNIAVAATTFYACVHNRSGVIFMVSAATACPAPFTKIEWNDVGATGL